MVQLRAGRGPAPPAGPAYSSSDAFLSPQIGSYFGGELCSIDLDQDGETELLLIGAPLFYGEQRGGRVFIYQGREVRTRAPSEAGKGRAGGEVERREALLRSGLFRRASPSLCQPNPLNSKEMLLVFVL